MTIADIGQKEIGMQSVNEDPSVSKKSPQWELALDQAGSADSNVLRRVTIFTICIALMMVGVLTFGTVQLPAYPQFSTFHAGFILLVDGITGFVLLGQFRYRRIPFYAFLASAYLFNALVAIPFILSFPGALKEDGSVIGGTQGAIWVWHFWHIIFPGIVALSLLIHQRYCGNQMPEQRVPRLMLASVFGAVILVVAVTIVVIAFQDDLPVLITSSSTPLTANFYLTGGLAAIVTAIAAFLAWRHGLRQRTILHLWLAVSLTAFLADIAASLGATARYTFGWYFGRVESMIATGILLVIFLGEVNRLYRKLASSLTNLSHVNERLVALVGEKNRLVAELQRSEEQVRQLAYFDVLTNLPNRRLLLDRLQQAIQQAKRRGYPMAVMFLDLDHFKQINDMFGHDTGDELLRQVAARLIKCIRGGDTVSRSGGDEFILVMAEISQPHDAALVAENILRSLNEPVVVGEHRFNVSVSIGIAIYPVDSTDDMQELMKKADMAMYAAKESGRNNYCLYGETKLAHPDRNC